MSTLRQALLHVEVGCTARGVEDTLQVQAQAQRLCLRVRVVAFGRFVVSNVRLFSNGEQDRIWWDHNCARCKKTDSDGCNCRCDIANSMTEAYWGDGTVPQHIALRSGLEPGSVLWKCWELEEKQPR
jgi:hypothetical protein